MSDYTPTTEEVREDYAIGLNEGVGAGWYDHRRVEFDRWLAAHDAEKRAEWEAEQGETEWEYECRIPPFDWKTCTDDPRFCPKGSDCRRRREAGTWLPVPDTTNNESEAKA